jgi:hypothetical protein
MPVMSKLLRESPADSNFLVQLHGLELRVDGILCSEVLQLLHMHTSKLSVPNQSSAT